MRKNKYTAMDSYGIGPDVIEQVRYHARKLIRHPSIHSMEIEDIEQELMLYVLSSIQDYDPERANWCTFVDRVLNHKIANLIENAKAEKRGGGMKTMSLDALLEDSDIEDSGFRDLHSDTTETTSLVVDLNRSIELLPPNLAELLVQLTKHTPSEISRITGVPRATLYESINKLRETLRKNGIHHYL